MKIASLFTDGGSIEVPENLSAETRRRLIAEGELLLIKDEFTAARQAFIDSLPIATDEQFKEVIRCLEREVKFTKGFKPNEDFRLNEQQEAEVLNVKKVREAYCIANKDRIVGDILEDKANKLVSCKVNLSVSGVTTTSLRFRKGGKSRVPVKTAIEALKNSGSQDS